MNDTSSHKELILTNKFTKWFISEFKYLELFDDSSTSGSDPFDSGGLVNDKLVFIEFKHRISRSEIFYENSKGGSIEKKIGQLLTILYKEQNSKIFSAIKKYYKDLQIPHLIIACDKVSSNSLSDLRKLLELKSVEWRFTYEVYIWEFDHAKLLISNKEQIGIDFSNRLIKIPNFPNTAIKRKNHLSYKKAIQILTQFELQTNFRILFNAFKLFGGNPIYNIQNVNFKFPKYSNKTIFGIWPNKSSKENGILLTVWLEAITKEINPQVSKLSNLGLKRNEFKIGHMGYNVYIKNEEEINYLFKKLKCQ